MNSDSPSKGKAYPVCNNCKDAGEWNCPHLNSDSVEAKKVSEILHNYFELYDVEQFDKLIAKLDKHYASKFIELIGEAEYYGSVMDSEYHLGRNKLRVELRKAVKELWGVRDD